jgi:hypothetical protein
VRRVSAGMSPQTPTLPPNDRSMWRRLVSRAHPDAGGGHDLFIWTVAVRDVVCGKVASAGHFSEPRPAEEPARVPFDPATEFSQLTARALALAEDVGGVYGSLLEMLADCEPPHMASPGVAWEQRGASYKKLAAIGHTVGMTKEERVGWYRVAEAVPLSDRHAGHILSKLQRAAA